MDDPTVFTFSVHGVRKFPFHKETIDLVIELPDGPGDTAYLDARERGVCDALSAAQPDLAVFLAGAAPCQDDRPGRLALSKQDLRSRDRTDLEHCHAAGVPVAIVMAGGYSFPCGTNRRATSSRHLATGQAAR
jgi:acetoin utilization deacetylase AcuC-like enzyme